MSYATRSPLTFSDKELLDLAIAWVVLSVAFALLLEPVHRGFGTPAGFAAMTGLSLVTVGVAFLCHELAHKVVAIRFGQIAEFRADYQMLFLAIMSALIGFLFAAPGAVYHRGRITARENGLISVAGPVTNIGLAGLFFPVLVVGQSLSAPAIVVQIGHMGVLINLFLAAFNMVPFGPLDGKSVLEWSKLAFGVTVAACGGLLVSFVLVFGIWPF